MKQLCINNYLPPEERIADIYKKARPKNFREKKWVLICEEMALDPNVIEAFPGALTKAAQETQKPTEEAKRAIDCLSVAVADYSEPPEKMKPPMQTDYPRALPEPQKSPAALVFSVSFAKDKPSGIPHSGSECKFCNSEMNRLGEAKAWICSSSKSHRCWVNKNKMVWWKTGSPVEEELKPEWAV